MNSKKITIALCLILLTLTSFIDINGYNDNNSSYSNYSGVWDTDFGKLRINQDGNKVTGSYSWYDGTIEGYVTDNGILLFTWKQDGGFLCAKGKGQFELNSTGTKFYGTWGCGSQYEGGGKWNGEKYY